MYEGGGEVHTGFWWGYLRETNNLKDLVVDGEIIFKWIIKMWDERAWNGLIWLRIGANGWLL